MGRCHRGPDRKAGPGPVSYTHLDVYKRQEEHRLTTLRMVKSALRSKEIDKREPLTDPEQTQVLATLLKQRRESVDSFTKGGRPELAEKEQAEILMIEAYMPQAAGEDQVLSLIHI